MKSFFQRIHESHSGTRKTTSDEPKPTVYQFWSPHPGSKNDKGHQKTSKHNRENNTGPRKANDVQASNSVPRQPDIVHDEHPGFPSTSRKASSISHSRPRTAASNTAVFHPHSSANHQLLGRSSEREKQNPPGGHAPSKYSSNQLETTSRTEDRPHLDQKYGSKPNHSRSRYVDTIKPSGVGGSNMLPDEATGAQSHQDRGRGRESERTERRKETREHELHKHGNKERDKDRGRDKDREKERWKERDQNGEQDTHRAGGRDGEREKDKEKGKETHEREREREKRRQGRYLAMEYEQPRDGERERETHTERKGDRMGKNAASQSRVPDTVKSRPSDGFVQVDGTHSLQGYHKEQDPVAHRTQRATQRGNPSYNESHEQDQGWERRIRKESELMKRVSDEKENSAQEGTGTHRGYHERRERSGHRHKDSYDYFNRLDEPDSSGRGFSLRYANAPLNTAMPQQASSSRLNLDSKHTPSDSLLRGAIALLPTHTAALPSRSTQASYQASNKGTDAFRKESTSIMPQRLDSQTNTVSPMLSSSEDTGHIGHHHKSQDHLPGLGTYLSSSTPTNAVAKPVTTEAPDTQKNNGNLPQDSSLQWPSIIKKPPGKSSVPTVPNTQTELLQETGHISFTTKAPRTESVHQSLGQRTFKVELPTSRITKEHSTHESLQHTTTLPRPSPVTVQYNSELDSRLVSTQPAKAEKPNLVIPVVEIRHPQQSNIRSTLSDPPSIAASFQRVISPHSNDIQSSLLKVQQRPEINMPPVQYHEIPPSLATTTKGGTLEVVQQEPSYFYGTQKIAHLTSGQSVLSQGPVVPIPTPSQEPLNSVRFPQMHALQSEGVSENLRGESAKTHSRVPSASEHVPPLASRRTLRHFIGPEDSAPSALMNSQSQRVPSLSNQQSRNSNPDLEVRSDLYHQDLKNVPGTITSPLTPVEASSTQTSMKHPIAEPEHATSTVTKLGSSFQTLLQARPAYGHDETEGFGVTATILNSLDAQELNATRQISYSASQGIVLNKKQARGYPLHLTSSLSHRGLGNLHISDTAATDNLHGTSMVHQTPIAVYSRGTPKNVTSETIPHAQSQSSHSLHTSYQTSKSTHVAQTSEHSQYNDAKVKDDMLQSSLPLMPIAHINPPPAAKIVPPGSARHHIVAPFTADSNPTQLQIGDALSKHPVHHLSHAHRKTEDLPPVTHEGGHSHTQLVLQSQQNPIQSPKTVREPLGLVGDKTDLSSPHYERTRFNAPVVTTIMVEGHEPRTVNQTTDSFRAVNPSNRATERLVESPKGSGIQSLPDKRPQSHNNNIPQLMKDATSTSGKHAHEVPPEEIKRPPIPETSTHSFRPSTAMGFRQISGEKAPPLSTTVTSPSPGHAALRPKFVRQISDDSNAQLATFIQRPSTALGSAYHRPNKTHVLGYSSLQHTSGLADVPNHRVATLHTSFQAKTPATDRDPQSRQGVAAAQSKRTRSTSHTQQVEHDNRLTNRQTVPIKSSSIEKGFMPLVPEALDSRQATLKNFAELQPHQSFISDPAGEKPKPAKQSQIPNLRLKDQLSAINDSITDGSRIHVPHERQPSTQRYGNPEKPSTSMDQTVGTSNQEQPKPKEDRSRKIETRGYYPPIQHEKLAELLSSPPPSRDLWIHNTNVSIATPTYLTKTLTSQTTSSNTPESTTISNPQLANHSGKIRSSPPKLFHDIDRATNNPVTYNKSANLQEASALPSVMHTTTHTSNDDKDAVPYSESPNANYSAPQPSYFPSSSLLLSARNEHKKLSPKQHPLSEFTLQITPQPAPPIRPHLNVSIPPRNEGAPPRTNSRTNTSTRATYNSESSPDMTPRQPVLNPALSSPKAHIHQEQLVRQVSEESVLATPSSIAPSVLKPSSSRTSIPASLSSQNEQQKRGLFSMFKSRTAQPSSVTKNETRDPPKERRSRDESLTNNEIPNRKDKEREKVLSRVKLPPPIIIPTPTSQPTIRKSPKSKVFTPFRYLGSKRHRTVSAASMEAQDGTAPNTVVGSPTASIHSSQPPLQPPPLRDPLIATQEWRKQEAAEARGVPGGKLRRARPGVVFDVAEDPPEDRKRQPQRSRVPSRSS